MMQKTYASILISCIVSILVGYFTVSVDAQKLTKVPKRTPLVGIDTLLVRISRNEKVEIKRTILSNSKKIVDKKVIEYRAYRIEFSNPKKVSLNLAVEDLIPYSKDGLVEVEILESSDAEIDFTHGRLAWFFHLKPKEKKNLDIKYNVIYPKNKIILGIDNVLQIQTIIRKTL